MVTHVRAAAKTRLWLSPAVQQLGRKTVSHGGNQRHCGNTKSHFRSGVGPISGPQGRGFDSLPAHQILNTNLPVSAAVNCHR